MEEGYPRTCAIGRHHSLEASLGLVGTPPTEQQWDELRQQLTVAARALGVEPVYPERPNFLLSAPLTTEQRSALDKTYLPLYSEALEADEHPREQMEIRDCGEKMVDLQAAARAAEISLRWSSRPFAASSGEYAGRPRIFWARESVAKCFVSAVKAFNAIELTPHVEDGYRPLQVQRGLYLARVQAVRQEYPYLSADGVVREARAKTACAPYRAAHMGGAAIDFTLQDRSARPLELGNEYPGGGAAAILSFPYVTWEQYRTRQLFACISRMAGLAPYPGEDWHVSTGDGLAALMSGESVVRFSALKDFDRTSGRVIPYDSAEARVLFSE